MPWPRLLLGCLLAVFAQADGGGAGDSAALTANWPQWRGPQRNGHSAETRLLGEWPQGGPKLLWQANDVGSGFSTPSVAGGRVFFLGHGGTMYGFVFVLVALGG